LLLLENSTRDIKTPSLSWKKQVDETIAGLRQLRAGEPHGDMAGIEISDTSLSDSEFKQLVAAVGGEIRINLGKIEEALETFAAAPEQIGLLDAVPQSLNQIQGALQILGQDRAADLVVSANQHVQNMRDGRMAADNAILDALAVAVGTVGAYIEGLERDRPNLESLLASAHNDLAAALTGKRPDSGNPAALLSGIETNLTAWSADHADRTALSAMQQNLRDIAWLAGTQKQERLAKLCEQMISLLDMVDSGEVPDEVEATLRQSYDTLAALAVAQLQGQDLAKAPPRASSKDKADAVVISAPAAPARNAAIEVEGDDDIIQIFIEDAREMIALINKTLPDWHADVSNRDALLDLRRAFHTLKGSGRMVGASVIAEFGWSLENMLNKVREGKVTPSEAMFDLLYRVRDALPEMVVQLEGGPEPDADVALLRAMADALADNRPVETAAAPEKSAHVEAASPAPATAYTNDAPSEDLPQLDAALLQIFSNETRGHTENVRSEIAKCRASEIGSQVSESLVRAAHTLQGSARAVGLRPMAEASAEIEKLLHVYQAHEHSLDDTASDLFERLITAVERMIDTMSRGETRTSGLLSEFANVAQGARESQARMAGVEAVVAKTAALRAPEVTEARVPPAIATPKPVPAPVPAPAVVAAANETIEENLDPELLEIFLEEATDIMAAIEESLTKWRSNRADKASVAELKRQLHTLKGGARMAGAMTMGNLGHHTESLLGETENGKVDADTELMDLLDEVHDALVTMIDQMQNHKPVSVFAATSAKVLARLGHAPAPAKRTPAAAKPEAGPAVSEADEEPPAFAPPMNHVPATVEHVVHDQDIARRVDNEDAAEATSTDRRGQIRVRTALLNELVNYAGEVSISRSRMEQQIFGLRENLAELNRNTTRFRDQIRELEIQSESQIMARAQEVASQLGEDFDPLELDRFTTLQTLSRSLAESLHDLFTIRSNLENYASQAETVLIQQARINTELQEGLMRTRMISFATQGARLRHIVRQTSRELGKRVELELVGAEVEVDRTVLDRMIGPFEHMIRNALDHGLETEIDRKRAGKSETGHIRIQASHEGSEIVIRFADDGAGLDIAAIRRKAIERGLMNSSTNLSDDELIQFILVAGFSTAGTVTQLSGRGVGMDVVHSEVKQLGGSITVDTRRGVGTTFIIRLPLTLSISQALMVRVSEQLYAIPLSSVVNILEVPVEQLNSIQMGRRPLLNWQDQVYPFMHLAVRLGIPPQPPAGRKVPVLLGRSGGRQVAIQVDGLAGTREVVIKPLGAQLAGIEGLGGATILGDGSVVLILDVPGLWLTEEGMHVVREVQGEEMVATAVQEVEAYDEVIEIEAPAPVRRNAIVMVVDDSITVRKVTQRHLLKRGIDVLLAKDGVDAVEQLRDQVPDVMLVDIEMPRMDGYELTSRIRSDSRLKQVPIIMITSRAGDKHRDKAFALDVNEYMTKPYQEEELFARINSLLPAHLAF
jgi:chemosensory pili system protein ChpA (sensor histidine kinase/response regulator)